MSVVQRKVEKKMTILIHVCHILSWKGNPSYTGALFCPMPVVFFLVKNGLYKTGASIYRVKQVNLHSTS
jgi:hypothetical protein